MGCNSKKPHSEARHIHGIVCEGSMHDPLMLCSIEANEGGSPGVPRPQGGHSKPMRHNQLTPNNLLAVPSMAFALHLASNERKRHIGRHPLPAMMRHMTWPHTHAAYGDQTKEKTKGQMGHRNLHSGRHAIRLLLLHHCCTSCQSVFWGIAPFLGPSSPARPPESHAPIVAPNISWL
jgi:hypothetical protein